MFMDQILVESPVFFAWFWWLVFINSLSLIFVIQSREARWILAVWLVNIWGIVLLDDLLDGIIGYARLLSLIHIVLWTPLIVYLALRVRHIAWRSITGRYLALIMLSNIIALILDYRALILWLLGERAAQL